MESKDKKMTELMEGIANGKIQLPDFQRGWVWSDLKIRKLIASITCGYPISAAMFLAYGGSLKLKYRAFEGVKGIIDKPEQLVLDGQQRLTSVYQAMFSDAPVKTTTENGKEIEVYYYIHIPDTMNGIEREDAIISVPKDRILKKNFNRDIDIDLSTRDKEFANKMFPVNLLFKISEALLWQNDYQKYHNYDSGIIVEYTKFAQNVIYPTSNYALPVILLDSSTPKEAVCQVFENVNTGGVPLTVFELVTAIFAMDAPDNWNLRDDWKERASRSFYGDILKESVYSTAFLTACTLLSTYKSGGTVSCKRKDVLNLKLEDYMKYADELEAGFVEAEKLLQRNRIFTSNNLPYSTQLIPLSVLCTLLKEKGMLDVAGVRGKIEQWLWCGIFGELYGGANETRFVQDVVGVMKWVDGDVHLPKTISDAYFSPIRLLGLQSRQSAAYKGIMALILKNQSKDFISGQDMDFTVFKAENIDIHHVFPKAYCVLKGYPKSKYNSIVNKTPISFTTNRKIGGAAPSEYLSKIEEKYSVSKNDLNKYIDSHWLNVMSMRYDDFDQFIVKRAGSLLDAIAKAMGKSISGRDSDEVIEAFGAKI